MRLGYVHNRLSDHRNLELKIKVLNRNKELRCTVARAVDAMLITANKGIYIFIMKINIAKLFCFQAGNKSLDSGTFR